MSKTNQFFQFINNQLRGYRKDRGNSRRFRSYYMSAKSDTRSNAAKIIDYALWRIIIFFTVFIGIFIRVQYFWITTFLTLGIVSILHLISIRLRDRKLETLKRQKRKYIASQRVYSELINKTIEELKSYMVEVFGKCGFSEFTFINSNHKYITYEATYKAERIMILFYIYKSDLAVELKEVKEFSGLLLHSKVKRGIIATTSDFTIDCINYVDGRAHDFKLILLNKELLLKLIEVGGMFPTEEEIDELVENKISRKEALWGKYKAAVLANRKTKSYFILSIILLIASGYTPYALYYRVVAGTTLLLTAATFIIKINSRRNSEEESWKQFNKMLRNI